MSADNYEDRARHRDPLASAADADGEIRPRFVHLKDASDLQVADGDPDIRGWDLCTTDGIEIGKVDDLVVDTSLMRVRYIEGELDEDGRAVDRSADRSRDGNRRVLIPIESARLDDDNDRVIVDYSMIDARSLPTYDRASMPLADTGTEYTFDDRNFFGARRQGRETAPYIASIDERDPGTIDDSGRGLR